MLFSTSLSTTFFSKTSKIKIYELKFLNCSNFNILLWFLINQINHDAFVLAATANVCSMVHLVCLFTKTHLLTLLQDNCLDLLCCAFLSKLSGCVRSITAFCQHLLRPIKSAVLADTDISANPNISARLIYRSISILDIVLYLSFFSRWGTISEENIDLMILVSSWAIQKLYLLRKNRKCCRTNGQRLNLLMNSKCVVNLKFFFVWIWPCLLKSKK